MKFRELMEYYDYNMTTIIRALHLARGTLKAWKASDHIPFKMQCYIEVMTDYKLKANKEDKEKDE